jgi:ABC-type iron transport system FetAB permease component
MKVKIINGTPYVKIEPDFYMKLITVASEIKKQDPVEVIPFAVDIVSQAIEEVKAMPGNEVVKDMEAFKEEIKRKVQIALAKIKNQSNFGGE